MLPYKKTRNGTLGIKNFKINQNLNLDLNYVYVNGNKIIWVFLEELNMMIKK